MRKLVLILIGFIAVVTFIRAFDNSNSVVDSMSAGSVHSDGIYSDGIHTAGFQSGVVAPAEVE
jgi:hypothetical protein